MYFTQAQREFFVGHYLTSCSYLVFLTKCVLKCADSCVVDISDVSFDETYLASSDPENVVVELYPQDGS